MKKYFVILFFAFSLSSLAQQGLQMEFGEVDSTELQIHRQQEYYQFINGTFGNNFIMDEISLPKFDSQQEYRNRYTFSIDAMPISNYIGGSIGQGTLNSFSPYFFNSQIFSSAAYQIGDKFVVGGFSYGANSPLSAPLPNQNGSYFDTHGSTMFMQYKVSKNFKIETRVNVSQGHGPGPVF
jgi:hypothetical protein